jgi:hypothetical protein
MNWTGSGSYNVNPLSIALYCCQTKGLLVIEVDTTLDVLDIDGYNSLVPLQRATWIGYSKELGPLYEMSLLSSLCFKI